MKLKSTCNVPQDNKFTTNEVINHCIVTDSVMRINSGALMASRYRVNVLTLFQNMLHVSVLFDVKGASQFVTTSKYYVVL